MSQTNRSQILMRAFKRAKQQNKSFSIRGLAQKMDLSPAFVSKVLNGKTDLPYERLNDFVLYLKIDKISEARLIKSFANKKTDRILGLRTKAAKKRDVFEKYEELGERQFSLLTSWYLIPILDLSTCEGFSDRPDWVAKRLGISIAEAKSAVGYLKAEGYLVSGENGILKKSSKHLRFPTEKSKQQIRRYHEILLRKTIHVLQTRTSQSDFDRRLISGIWIAANPKNFQRAQAKLSEAMYEIAEILSEGNASEIYYLATQLFPVTD